MTGAVRRRVGALAAFALTGAIVAASGVPYPPEPDHALLRLSWRARGEPVRECRRLSGEELAQLPIHMRRPEVCEGRILPYRLVVTIDGRTVISETILPSGARQDRPIYVYREMRLPPGRLDLSVRFVQESRSGTRAAADGSAATSSRATPARLALEAVAEMEAGSVLLVTYDPESRALVMRTPAPDARRGPPNPSRTEPS